MWEGWRASLSKVSAHRIVVERDTTGPNWVDVMDDSPDRTARKRFIAIYLDVSPHLAKVRVGRS